MAAPKASGNGETRLSTLHVLLIVCLGLVGQTIMISHFSSSSVVLFGPMGGQNLAHDGAPSPRDSGSYPGNNPLAIPPGQAVNLPSVRDIDKGIDRKAYGGEGDGKHLGGFTEIDMHGISPAVWKHVVQDWGVHSVLDVGCGRGISTSWFVTHGLRTQCVEGSHDAVERSMVPDKASVVVEHDFSRGPWWPGQTFDAVWAVEFLEHVNLQYHFNYVAAFRKAAILMVTSSRWGGWHHVEVHPDEWWIRKYELYGFRYDQTLTMELRRLAKAEGRGVGQTEKTFGPTGKPLFAQHVSMSMKVFINPVVAALPEHAHLFAKFGCFQKSGPGGIADIVNKECGKGKNGHLDTPLAPSFYPLNLTTAQDQAWEEIIKANVHEEKKG